MRKSGKRMVMMATGVTQQERSNIKCYVSVFRLYKLNLYSVFPQKYSTFGNNDEVVLPR